MNVCLASFHLVTCKQTKPFDNELNSCIPASCLCMRPAQLRSAASVKSLCFHQQPEPPAVVSCQPWGGAVVCGHKGRWGGGAGIKAGDVQRAFVLQDSLRG